MEPIATSRMNRMSRCRRSRRAGGSTENEMGWFIPFGVASSTPRPRPPPDGDELPNVRGDRPAAHGLLTGGHGPRRIVLGPSPASPKADAGKEGTAMITLTTKIRVDGLTGREVTDFLIRA